MGEPADPLFGVSLASSKVLALRSKWRQELKARAILEREFLIAGDSFGFEPIEFPYCAHFSRVPWANQSSGQPPEFVLCERVNPPDTLEDCKNFAPRKAMS